MIELKKIPFSYMWCLKYLSDSPKTVLDIGCGGGDLMKEIADSSWQVTGIDIYEKDLSKAKRKKIYKKLIKGDVVKVCEKLVRQKDKFDLVFCSQLIEHISKKDGKKLLRLSEKLAEMRIYFGTPRGFMNQPEVFVKGSPYQVHKSGWSLSDFRDLGYKVYGVGFQPIWGESGLARSKNVYFANFWTAIGFLLSPLCFIFPEISSGIMAVKLKHDSNRN